MTALARDITNTTLTTVWSEPIWCRQSFESDGDFAAFESMRQMPKRMRNMQHVARYCSLPYDSVLTLFSRHHWRFRLDAHDAFMVHDSHTLLQRQKDDARAEHLGLLQKGREVLERELDNLLERQRTLDAQGANVSLMKPSEMTALLEKLIKLDRLIMGEVTERAEEEFDLSQFTMPELMQWKALMQKAKREC